MALLQDYLWFFCHHSWQQCLFFISDLNYFSHHSMLIMVIDYCWFSCSSFWTDGHQFVSHSVYDLENGAAFSALHLFGNMFC